jgi:hypothetical protein
MAADVLIMKELTSINRSFQSHVAWSPTRCADRWCAVGVTWGKSHG